MQTFRKQYADFDEKVKVRQATRVSTGTETPVQQQFKKDADINELVRRFGLLGKLPPAVDDPRYYGDVSDIFDLRTAMERMRDAQAKFMALPASVRKRFHDTPAELFDFLDDPSNRDEAVKLGLLNPPPPPPEPAPADDA